MQILKYNVMNRPTNKISPYKKPHIAVSNFSVISFRGDSYFNIKSISDEYLEQKKPPKNILNIGLHGSSSSMNVKPYSDIDFYCICEKQDNKSIKYLRGFVEHINKKTNRWVDMMVGHLNNNDAFKLNSFVLNDIKINSVNLYGINLHENINQMLQNYKGESSQEYLYKELKTSGHRIKRAIVDLNKHQLLISKPPFPMNGLSQNLNGSEIKARTIAKQILASCAFANTVYENAMGIASEFSKKDAPEKFKQYFKIKSNLPEEAKEIYYNENHNINLSKFANQDAIKWLKVQEIIEKRVQKIIKLHVG